MAARDLNLDRVELRRRNLVTRDAMPYPIATISPYESKDESGQRRLSSHARSLLERNQAGREKSKLAGKLIDGRYHGLGRRLLHRRRRGGAEGNRAHRARAGRPIRRVRRLVGDRAGSGDGIRADRGRRAGGSVGAHPRRLSRDDVLCERRLRRLSFALDGDGRLGDPRRGGQSARGHSGGGSKAFRLRSRPTWKSSKA